MKSSTLLDGAVEDRDAEAAAFDVQGQVLAHHGQADQAEIAKFAHGIVPIMLECGGTPPRWFEESGFDNIAFVPPGPADPPGDSGQFYRRKVQPINEGSGVAGRHCDNIFCWSIIRLQAVRGDAQEMRRNDASVELQRLSASRLAHAAFTVADA